jgi:hypothetical protein
MAQETRQEKAAYPLPDSRGSLRARLRLWTIAVFTVTLAVFTALGIAEDRRERLAMETAHARALLAHLSGMPELRQTREATLARLGQLRDLLGATGADVELVAGAGEPSETAAGRTPLAWRPLELNEGSFALLYSTDASREQVATARSVAVHTLHGLLGLAALIAGFEVVLRLKLVAPLRTMASQLHQMRRGGWSPRLPVTDQELGELNRAIAGLGPALEGQVHHWIEAERRIAMADVFGNLRRSFGDLHERIRQAAEELGTQHLVAPDGAKRMRALLVDLDQIQRVLEEEERRRFGPERAASPESGSPVAWKEERP